MAEQTVPLSFVMWLIGGVATLLGGCWGIFKYFEYVVGRVYTRMDENKKIYYEEFVLKKVYEVEKQGRTDLVNLKFEQQMGIFNEKIESLKNELRAFATAATAAATSAATSAATAAALAASNRVLDRAADKKQV